ncbi:MAG: transporter substrate-binding domain-containing protein [Hyphomicrobiaceae bacterium]
MRMLTAAILFVLAIAAASPGLAAGDGDNIAERISRGRVTILTDGVTEASGLMTEMAARLASAVDEEGQIRVLPVLGYGSAASVRDLLYLRGIDLAILNADILEYLRIEGQMPEAERRVRLVTRLADKLAFIAARGEIASFADLKGKRIVTLGADSESHVTARVLLHLAGVEATIIDRDMEGALAALDSGEAAAFVSLGRNPTELQDRLQKVEGVHLIGLPASPEIDRVYRRWRLPANAAPGLVEASGLDTVRVPTVLASFAWRAGHSRKAGVDRFVKALLTTIAEVKAAPGPSIWKSVDMHGEVAGWERYQAAAEVLASLPADAPGIADASPLATTAGEAGVLADLDRLPGLPGGEPGTAETPPVPREVASLSPVEAGGADVTGGTAAGAARPAEVAVLSPEKTADAAFEPTGPAPRLLLSAYGPVADERMPAGGLAIEILNASLGARGAASQEWVAAPAEALARLADGAADVAFPFSRPDCAAVESGAGTGAAAAAALCEGFLFTEEAFSVLDVFFARRDGGFRFTSDADVIGRAICAVEGTDRSVLDASGRGWLAQDLITLVSQPSLEGCLALLESGEVDAVLADELTGRAAIARLGIGEGVDMLVRPVATRDLRAIVAKSNPRAAAIVEEIDRGLRALRARGEFAEIVERQLTLLWSANATQ